MFPPVPDWNSLHPLVVHFPVALLTVAPVLVLLGMLAGKSRRGLLLAALATMTLGTAGTFLAAATGEAAAEHTEVLPGVSDPIAAHERLGETTRNLFAGLTALYAFVVFVPEPVARRLRRVPERALLAGFLVIYVLCLPVLASTAHRGGLLVHRFGLHADLGSDEAGDGGMPDSFRGGRQDPGVGQARFRP